MTSCSKLAFVIMSPLLGGLTYAHGQKSKLPNFPEEVIIGSDSFIDIGPPFDYYTVYVLKSDVDGTSVRRLNITPHGDACLQPATVVVEQRQTKQTLPDLLEGKNPCAISERSLHREEKRCKHCLVFSGAYVAMQVQCGAASRIIKAKILDRDMFASYPNTPQYTAGTYKLLGTLNGLFGSSPLDQPIFALNEPPSPPKVDVADAAIEDLAAGKFNTLFPPGGETVSSIYAEALVPHDQPTATVVQTVPISPSDVKTLIYPPIARVAHIQGTVRLKMTVGESGAVEAVEPLEGQPMLSKAAENAVKGWHFDPRFAGQSTEGTIQYKMNCNASTTP